MAITDLTAPDTRVSAVVRATSPLIELEATYERLTRCSVSELPGYERDGLMSTRVETLCLALYRAGYADGVNNAKSRLTSWLTS